MVPPLSSLRKSLLLVKLRLLDQARKPRRQATYLKIDRQVRYQGNTQYAGDSLALSAAFYSTEPYFWYPLIFTTHLGNTNPFDTLP
jgi:hypothetical protein